MSLSDQSIDANSQTSYSFVNLGTDGRSWQDVWGKPPRPRKRITPIQLKRLEMLFERETHPTREERMVLAQQIGMELRSVTIWLQNKRQIVRKNALATTLTPNAPSPTSSSASSPKVAPASLSSSASTCSNDSIDTPTSDKARPSLDRVASLSELPSPARGTPWTTAPTSETSDIWHHMPSSPPSSPPPAPAMQLGRHRSAHTLHKATGRPYPLTRTASLDSAALAAKTASTGKTRNSNMTKYIKPSRTLEWACAHALQRTQAQTEDDEGALTEKEDGNEQPDTGKTILGGSDGATNAELQAALALCGLINGP